MCFRTHLVRRLEVGRHWVKHLHTQSYMLWLLNRHKLGFSFHQEAPAAPKKQKTDKLEMKSKVQPTMTANTSDSDTSDDDDEV